MDVCVDPSRQEKLPGCIQLSVRRHLAADLRDLPISNADVGIQHPVGIDNTPVSNHQLELMPIPPAHATITLTPRQPEPVGTR